MKLNYILSLFDSSIADFFSIFFSKSYTVFLISFILGIVLVGIGILMKIFNWGLKLNEYFSKNKISKEKTSEENLSKNKRQEIEKKLLAPLETYGMRPQAGN